ncbi:MAG: helix-turn-helix domain-containing protein, partial [Clostridium saudiense]|nr:helix-turn-helix domain-containing protein [Clostridium saudiense]
QGYSCSKVDIINYKGQILMFGKFEDMLEHAKSIKDTIQSVITCKCYISYCNVENYLTLKKHYDDTRYKIDLAFKYNIIDGIFDANKIILEGIIDSVSEEMKKGVYDRFEKGISKLDNEMIRTMEVFFKCGLNLSEAAKELYIHRNTLIYRLDKIQKYTNYDIRDFNDAVLLKIIFFIWKEKKS